MASEETQPQQPEILQSSLTQPLVPSANFPKRKPVPAAQEPIVKEVSTANDHGYEQTQQLGADPEKSPEATTWDSQRNNNASRRKVFLPTLSLVVFDKVRLGPLERYLPQEPRKRRYTMAGIFAGLFAALLVLIIGLAVGLTVNKKTQNLPLPTSHGGPYTGDLTYYAPGLGACGITSSSSDSICAVSHLVFDAAQTGSNPNANPLCGLKIRLRRNDESVDVTIVDRCVGCEATDIDTTTSVFSELADIDQGRVTVEWAWLESSPVNVTNLSK
ncbi:hypothetical protein UA08_02410 [Talaromyces atroroseus]|uniref:RlpA-like protein double-psi beta-barrel domain-containing protein n=1 Tax=Talaromyces atroroseus TaxID=1441469 RepID=A0A225AKJ2_TALAT|nr:hypothetical protein UA08_02410 [Talaromyces atroroseus]OKL62052.1 hypothetical protein UA08_02410 [Talaromyces atroroseus]